MARQRRWSTCRGVSVIEAVVAAGVLATVLTGVLPLVTTVVTATSTARRGVLATHLAQQRLAQLRALTYTRTAAGVIVDTQTDLALQDIGAGGSGLSPSGLAPLQGSMAGWVDWLDEQGDWVAADVAPPPSARFRRRWGVLTAAGPDCVHVWVDVTPLPAPDDRTVHAGAIQCAWGVSWP